MSDASTHYYRAKYGSTQPYNLDKAVAYALRIGDLSCIEWLRAGAIRRDAEEPFFGVPRCPVCEGLDQPGQIHNPDAPYCTQAPATDPRPDPLMHPEYWTE